MGGKRPPFKQGGVLQGGSPTHTHGSSITNPQINTSTEHSAQIPKVLANHIETMRNSQLRYRSGFPASLPGERRHADVDVVLCGPVDRCNQKLDRRHGS